MQVTYGAGTDRAPNTGTVTLSPAAPRTNQTLTATASGFSDPDGDPITLRYEWFRNGTLIAGATGTTLNLNTVGNGDRGDRIRVEAYATDNRGAASDPASAKVTVANTAPTAGSVTIKPLPPSRRDLVKAIPAGFSDIDGDALTYTLPVADQRHRRRGRHPGHVRPQRPRPDQRPRRRRRARRRHRRLQSAAARGGSPITATNATPLPGTVALTPAPPKTNQIVTATPSGFSDPDGSALTYRYQWSRNGAAIAGATASTLDLSVAGRGDRGDTISVSVTAVDPGGLVSDAVAQTTTVANDRPDGRHGHHAPDRPGDGGHRRPRSRSASPTSTATRSATSTSGPATAARSAARPAAASTSPQSPGSRPATC